MVPISLLISDLRMVAGRRDQNRAQGSSTDHHDLGNVEERRDLPAGNAETAQHGCNDDDDSDEGDHPCSLRSNWASSCGGT